MAKTRRLPDPQAGWGVPVQAGEEGRRAGSADGGELQGLGDGRLLGVRDVLRLGIGEGPDFIALDALRLHVAHLLVVEGRACRAGVHQQLRHRVDAHVGNAADRPHGRAFAEHAQDLDALGEGQLVHAPYM